ncbi:serine/arginine repetitive matrix protein 1-like [Daphnia pulicaria]|uniref:serine/arginine repetitive matrix protein 1-like n=1 Tax=Daphnia pulicaria TaxID=35523 RepID=UPI001EECD348|nr:serine/arginine repetitive matrix protein 1-like [Daphnia pulicaria]
MHFLVHRPEGVGFITGRQSIEEPVTRASYPQNKYMPGLWYKQFCNSARKCGRLAIESQEIQDAVQRLYVYWAGYWLVRQTPARFSVNGDKSRTNNEECEETARRDFLVASRGGKIRRPTPNRYIVRDEQILGRARDLSQNIITIYEFLMMSSVSFEPYDEGLPENELEAPAPRRQRRLARLQGDGRQQVRTRAGELQRDQGEPEADAPRRPVGRPPRRDRVEPEADAPRRPVGRPPRRDRVEPEADAPRRPIGRPPRKDRGEPEADAPRRPVGRPPRRVRGDPEADAPRHPVGRPPRRDRGEPEADAPRRSVGRPPRRVRGEPEADAPPHPVGRPPRRDQGEPEADAPRRPVGRPPRRDRGEPVANAVAL